MTSIRRKVIHSWKKSKRRRSEAVEDAAEAAWRSNSEDNISIVCEKRGGTTTMRTRLPEVPKKESYEG
jgi:hypothetical protein